MLLETPFCLCSAAADHRFMHIVSPTNVGLSAAADSTEEVQCEPSPKHCKHVCSPKWQALVSLLSLGALPSSSWPLSYKQDGAGFLTHWQDLANGTGANRS